MATLAATFDHVLERAVEETRRVYGDRLRAIAVFGSVGRRTMRPDSDVDLLVVVDDLPTAAVARSQSFHDVERACEPALAEARHHGVTTRLSAVLRTSQEIASGSPLMFDMVDDARILFDPAEVLATALTTMRRRLAALGARRHWRDGWWYWDLKPDYRAGEIFEI